MYLLCSNAHSLLVHRNPTSLLNNKMDMQTNSRTKKLVKLLERLIAQEYLYSEEQIIKMKKQLRVVKEEMNTLNTKLKRGFGS